MGYYSEWQLLVIGNTEQLSVFQSFVETQAGDTTASFRQASESRFEYLANCWDDDPVTLRDGRVGFRYVADRDKCYEPEWSEFRAVLSAHLRVSGLEYSFVRVGEDTSDIEEDYSEGADWRGHARLTIDNPFELVRKGRY